MNQKPPFTDRELQIARNVANEALEAAMELIAEYIALTQLSSNQKDNATLIAWIEQLSVPHSGLLLDMDNRVQKYCARHQQ